LKGVLLVVCHACSVEAMSPHCLTYLLHKFDINYLFQLHIIQCALFIRVTDCSIRVSRSFTRGLQPPAPQGCYTYMIMIIKMIEIYNIAAQPYYCYANCIKTITPCAPLTYFCLKRRRFITSYVRPVMQQYKPTTV